jgi:hypothetical protein
MDSAEFNEQYITPKQLEEIFGISRGYQYKLRMRKNYTDESREKHSPIPFIKIGNRILYDIDSITEWIKSQEIK